MNYKEEINYIYDLFIQNKICKKDAELQIINALYVKKKLNSNQADDFYNECVLSRLKSFKKEEEDSFDFNSVLEISILEKLPKCIDSFERRKKKDISFCNYLIAALRNNVWDKYYKSKKISRYLKDQFRYITKAANEIGVDWNNMNEQDLQVLSSKTGKTPKNIIKTLRKYHEITKLNNSKSINSFDDDDEKESNGGQDRQKFESLREFDGKKQDLQLNDDDIKLINDEYEYYCGKIKQDRKLEKMNAILTNFYIKTICKVHKENIDIIKEFVFCDLKNYYVQKVLEHFEQESKHLTEKKLSKILKVGPTYINRIKNKFIKHTLLYNSNSKKQQ